MKPYTPPKPNKKKAGLPGDKRALPMSQPATPVIILAPAVDWSVSIKDSSLPKKAERPAGVIRVGTTTTARLSGLPATSSLEIRIFGLPHYHVDDAMKKATKALTEINIRDGKALAPTDPKYIEDPLARFIIAIGEPFLTVGTHQCFVKIRFTDGSWQSSVATLEAMEIPRMALIENHYEAYWSSAHRIDKRCFGMFYFTLEPGKLDSLDPSTAGEYVSTLCEESGHPLVGHFGDFKRDRKDKKRLSKTVKFARQWRLSRRLEAERLHYK